MTKAFVVSMMVVALGISCLGTTAVAVGQDRSGESAKVTGSGEVRKSPSVSSDSAVQNGPPANGAAGDSAMPSIIEHLPDYSGNLAVRKYLTGDWGGLRTELAEQGFLFDLNITQTIQGNAHGGKNTSNAVEYFGSADLTLRFDTARMGLWPGGLLTLRGETQFGHGVNSDVGSVMSANADTLFPLPNDPGLVTLSEYYFTQALSERFAIQVGKVDFSRGLDQNMFASNERSQFMNLGLRMNPVLFPFGPYTTMAAAAIWMPTDWLKVTTGINDNDPEGAVTRTGFNTAFHGRDWYNVGQEYELKIKPFDLVGHQRIGWAWSSRDYLEFESDGRLGLGGQLGPIRRFARIVRLATRLREPQSRPDDWVVYYNFDQYVYTEPNDPEQGIGIFGRVGWSTGESNPIGQFYSFGIGGQGILPERDNDTFGLGYYFAKMSDHLPEVLELDSEQGVELYYNIEVTPWLHVTPDLQMIINPGAGFQDRDVAVVYGLRAEMSF